MLYLSEILFYNVFLPSENLQKDKSLILYNLIYLFGNDKDY